MKLLAIDHNAVDDVARGLYESLVREHHIEIRLVVPSRWHDNYAMRETASTRLMDGLTMTSLPVVFPTRTHRLMYRGLARVMDDFSPDLVYVNAEPENYQALQSAWLCAGRSVPFIVSSWRNIDYTRQPFPYRAEWTHRCAETYVRKRCAGVVAFTDAAESCLTASGFKNVSVIPPEIDIALFSPSTEERGHRDVVIFGYFGRLDRAKGVDLLLRAAAGLSFPWKVLIVGSGEEGERLKTLAFELGCRERVVFHDPVKRREVPALLRQCSAIVLPSRATFGWKEQFGRVLVEAMSCGIPVIGSDSGYIPRVIGENGLVFREGNVEDLQRSLTILAENQPGRAKLVRDGRRYVEGVHATGLIARKYADLFSRARKH